MRLSRGAASAGLYLCCKVPTGCSHHSISTSIAALAQRAPVLRIHAAHCSSFRVAATICKLRRLTDTDDVNTPTTFGAQLVPLMYGK